MCEKLGQIRRQKHNTERFEGALEEEFAPFIGSVHESKPCTLAKVCSVKAQSSFAIILKPLHVLVRLIKKMKTPIYKPDNAISSVNTFTRPRLSWSAGQGITNSLQEGLATSAPSRSLFCIWPRDGIERVT